MKKIFFLSLILLAINNIALCQLTDTLKVKEIPIGKDIVSIESEPEFVGGAKEWAVFLRNNLRAEIASINGAPAGKYNVVVKFVVDTDGSVSDFVAQTKHGYGMEKEVIRILKKSPKWQPGKLNGEPIRKIRFQPVTFLVRPE